MKDIDINMHGLGLLFMPLVGTKMAKSRFWSVPPLSTGSFQRSPEPQLLLWPKAASAAVNALRRNRTSGTPKGVPTMWATRGVRGSPAHRQSAFLVLEVCGRDKTTEH